MKPFFLAGKRPRLFQRPFAVAGAFMAIALLVAAPAAADIYRYVDRDGVIHYTDDPAKVPAEYESAVEHKKVPRSTDAPAVAASEETVAEEPNAEEIEAGEIEEPEQVEQPPEAEEAGSATEESNESQEEGTSGETEENAGEEGGNTSGETDENPAAGEQSPPAAEADSGSGDGSADVSPQRRQLLEERQALLEKQAGLLDNKTYQKRKLKRKYQNRPHMQELTDEEARIEARLQEIETALR